MPKVPEKVLTGRVACAGKAMPDGFWHAPSGDALLLLGNCVDQLKRLPARSIHMCCTSPPYYALRDYGVDGQLGAETLHDCDTKGQAQCGDCFVCNMVKVFREVRRVLRDDGTCWLNLGDSYCGSSPGRNDVDRMYGEESQGRGLEARRGLQPGNLIGIPWRVALALQHDGWVLRQDIIWYAPNKMPESVTNRCTKSHEHIFLLTKSESYYFDNVAIEEESKTKAGPSWEERKNLGAGIVGNTIDNGVHTHGVGTNHNLGQGNTKNKRDVWVVSTRGYPGAHFATFSPQLITPCILAGTSEHGCCAKCGAPYERVVDKNGGIPAVKETKHDRSIGHRNGLPDSGSTLSGTPATRTTAGWRPTCHCNAEVEPCVVLDPFVGSGTTVATAIQYGRCGVGVDLSEKYLLENAIPRIEAAISGEKVQRKDVPVLVDTSPPPKVKVLRVGTSR